MKRAAMAVGLALATAQAQAGELRGGVWAGPNLSTLQIENAPGANPERRTGAGLGALLAWRPDPAWSVELRPSYASRGADVSFQGAGLAIRASFVEVPLLVTRDLGDGRVRPYLLAGAAVGFQSSVTAEIGGQDQDVSDDFAGTDASLRVGVGVRLGQGRGQPFLEAEYSHGLSDLNEQRAGFGSGVGAIRTRGFQLRAGIAFGRGGK